MDFSLQNGVVAAPEGVRAGDLDVAGERIAPSVAGRSCPAVDLRGGSCAYPALVNAHDHFRGNYLPRCGPAPGEFYLTWLPWDGDLKASACYAERTRALDVEGAYSLSAYKCLFSGVVTACDHFPHAVNEGLLSALPVRVIQNYGLAHACSSYELPWGGDVREEHAFAVRNGGPFVTHLSEGFDEESMAGLSRLEALGVLDERCLLVHCLAFSDEDIAKTARSGASVAWCGASNMLMFNTSCKVKKFIDAGVNVAIGTDSSHTGMCNMLSEMKYDRALYRAMYGEDLSAKAIFAMVTLNAAKALQAGGETGSLAVGKRADVLLLKAKVDDPFENLLCAECEDVELVVSAGRPLFGEARFAKLFGSRLPEGYTTVAVGGREMFVAGDPAALYARIRKAAGFKKILDFLPFEP